MKLLMFGAPRFWYRTFEKTLAAAPDADEERTIAEVAVIFVHVEPADQTARGPALTKLLKNVKWMANKRGFRNVVLHSFTHLSDEKAEPEFAEALLDEAAERLRGVGFDVVVTPFGYLLEWELRVYGESLSRVFKSF